MLTIVMYLKYRNYKFKKILQSVKNEGGGNQI